MYRTATPLGAEPPSPVGDVIWDLTKIVAIASATAYLVKMVLKRG